MKAPKLSLISWGIVFLLFINFGYRKVNTSSEEKVTAFPQKNQAASGAYSKIEQTRDIILERIIAQVSAAELNQLTAEQLDKIIQNEEKSVFANKHWKFLVDQPALVSVMRHKKQETVPFWLTEKGFDKTTLTVSNENYEYEVWQKEFPSGEICLGINGFDLHRVVYFVTIGPIDGGQMPKILSHFPDQWKVIRMEKGAYTYNDWDELVIEQFPQALEGHHLFTTIRGRAREAALLNAFRKTSFPASSDADQIRLTWSDDPASTQVIQWRTDTAVSRMKLRYWSHDSDPHNFLETDAQHKLHTDKYIYNNPTVKYWETGISELQPDTRYAYRIYNPGDGKESATYSFRTAPKSSQPFSFIYLGDTHNDEIVEQVLKQALEEAPDASFWVHSGDHVNTGLFRDLWDKYFYSGRKVFPNLTYVPALGNHDSQDGLPPTLFTQLFKLPQNGKCRLTSGRNFTFSYGNSRFFIIDSTGDIEQIACWLEKELRETNEKWKIAVTHFPPFTTDDSYPEIRKSWSGLFDQYHVDLVLSGHVHQYFRSFPINNEKVVAEDDEGTIYVSSVTVEPRQAEPVSERYNKVYANTGGLFQIITVDDHQLDFLSKRYDGTVIDYFTIKK